MAVKSPCVEPCVFAGRIGFCVGWLRTRDEVRDWKRRTDRRRHKILNGGTCRQSSCSWCHRRRCADDQTSRAEKQP
ncbi:MULTISPECIES: DUF1289 domain-containing protein [Burkholderia]|uniref:DUF1289 domain-containing protein n=1 Tax=Burkholderia cepacia TaxID=292 RepID=A0ABN5D9F4_BURCE|nr:DUF1289 domain-containing protein [Burkholderia cepacia]ASE98543.1 DUF1289 domain-containing protein [Burkholderia cepacia]ATF83195.1 DUF1289 domain-containing protein [Burkholderia cepacia]MCA7891138.1 DUF1289 domain-containing protein [Burkholderia cepacia]MCA7938031.1 DUF1289 domain-containing protein [Burkholderia cepacia]MCA8053607.1 DUF1289 domain-containing protein [Burkholderia cepacia]